MTHLVHCFLLLLFGRATAENPMELMLVFMLLVCTPLVWKTEEVARRCLAYIVTQGSKNGRLV